MNLINPRCCFFIVVVVIDNGNATNNHVLWKFDTNLTIISTSVFIGVGNAIRVAHIATGITICRPIAIIVQCCNSFDGTSHQKGTSFINWIMIRFKNNLITIIKVLDIDNCSFCSYLET